MELFDTHAHFEGDKDAIAAARERAAAAGVTRIMAVGGSPSLNAGTGGFRYRAVGYDRDRAGEENPPLDFSVARAVGEIGLDYHCPGASRRAQLDLFISQLQMAQEADLPVVVHTRDADGDTLGALREVSVRGIIHCFTGTPAFCKSLLDLGFFISISGIVTFRAADNVRESALAVPDDRILIETDSPYLAPVPVRGRRNEPAFLVHTARFLAGLRKTPLEDFARLTTSNAISLLGDCVPL